MNGAAEALLEELLRQANITNVHLASMLKQGASLSGGSTGGGMPGFVKSIGPAAIALGALSAATSVVSSVFSALGTILGKVVSGFTDTVSNLYNLATTSALGTTKLSEFYAAFRDIPIIGKAFGIFSDMIRYQEELLDRFQKLSNAGALFGGSLTAMREAAGRAYLSVDEFADVVTANSDVFARMGNTVDSGVRKFVSIQRDLLEGEYGGMIRGLGLTAKGTGDMIASFMRAQGLFNRDKMLSDKEIIKGTAEYAYHLSVLSQLTGQQVDTMRKKLDEINADVAYENYLKMLGPDKAKVVTDLMAEVLATGGEDAAKWFRNAVQGINVPMDEMQQHLNTTTNGGLIPLFDSLVKAAESGQDTATVISMLRTGMYGLGQTAEGFRKQLGPVGALLSSTILKSSQTIMRFSSTAENKDKLDRRAIEAEINIAKARDSEAEKLKKAQQDIKNFGDSLMQAVWRVIDPMKEPLKEFATSITKATIGIIALIGDILQNPAFKEGMKSLANWIKTTTAELANEFKEGGIKGLLTRIGQLMVNGFVSLWDTFKPVFTNIVTPTITALFTDLVSNIWTYTKDYITGGPRSQLATAEANIARTRSLIEGYTGDKNAVGYQGWLTALQGYEKESRRLNAIIAIEDAERAAASDARWKKVHEGIQKYTTSPIPVAQSADVRKIDNAIAAAASKNDQSTTGTSPVVASETTRSENINNILLSEMQVLNRQVSSLIAVNREAADQMKNNVSATRALNGNLYAR